MILPFFPHTPSFRERSGEIFHRGWKAHMRPVICQWRQSYELQQRWTSGPHQQSYSIWMEISTEKSKIRTKSTNNISAGISINSQKLEVISFKYLGSTLCKEGTCSAEIFIRIASAVAAMARLNRIWQCNIISFASKFKSYKSVVTVILLCGCET